jgi:molecular chaperone GrpE
MSVEKAKQQNTPQDKKEKDTQETLSAEKDDKAPAAVKADGAPEPAGIGAKGETPEYDQVKVLEEQTRKLEEESSDLKDQLLRKTADFENFRKRMFREREEGIKYANAALLTEVIAVIDDFERAIQSAGESRDFDSFHQGVELIEKRLVSMLEKNWGLKRFSSIGEEFDPDRHQAIALEESDRHEKAVVLEDYQKGYLLHDRVLRPAKVKVSKPTSPEDLHQQQKQTNDSGEGKE